MKQIGIIKISFLSVFILLGFNVYSDTIYCCQTDTLKLAYYFEDSLYNTGCDINIDDVLIIGSAESVFVKIEPITSSFSFPLSRKQHDICEFVTCVFEDYLTEISFDGKYLGYNPEVFYSTSFDVVIGDSLDVYNPTIIPNSINNPTYDVSIADDFNSYMWSNGADSSSIVVDQPGEYIIQATNHCGEIFENQIAFDSAAFNEEQFYAGKISGYNIQYINFDPDSVVSFNYNVQGNRDIDFDLNNDGTTDMVVFVYLGAGMGGSYRELSVNVVNGCKIAVDGSVQVAAKLQEGQIINGLNSYSGLSPIYLFESYWSVVEPGCNAGIWNNSDNYLGYSITNESGITYGWVHISYASDYEFVNLIIDGYAYTTSLSFGVDEKNNPTFQVYPNPFLDNLKINTHLQNYSITLMDVFGKAVFRKDNMSGNDDVNLQSLSSGIYFLIIESETFRQNQKVIRQ